MELTLKPILNIISKLMQDQLRRQVPVDTGKLQKSITVRAIETEDGVQMRTGYLTYGIFLDSGTGRYRKPNPNATWNPKPGKGRMGIKPRYWTNIDKATTAKISQIIQRELAKQIRQSFKKK